MRQVGRVAPRPPRSASETSAHTSARPEGIGALITRTPGVCGGDPCIAGTRISVKLLVGFYKLGWTPEEMSREYTHLSMAQIHAALAYYHLNKEEIEHALADDAAASERHQNLSVANPAAA